MCSLYYQIALHGRRDLPLAMTARQGFEMCLLRMLSFKPVATKPPKGGLPQNSPLATRSQQATQTAQTAKANLSTLLAETTQPKNSPVIQAHVVAIEELKVAVDAPSPCHNSRYCYCRA
jgi:DNA polymerase-3 subunit gamma/tau